MIKYIYCFLLFASLTVLGQNSLSQENEIYNEVDKFVANPSVENLKRLAFTEQNFWKNPKQKTKNEYLALVILNCNKAYYENQFGKIDKAISSYEKAWQIYQKKKLSNYDITEYCLKPLGNLYTVIGDYDNAENTIKQYYFIANTTKNQEQTIAALLNLSNLYQNTGKVNQAIELLEKTLKTEKLSAVQKGNLLNNLGNNYFIGGQNYLLHSENHIKAKSAFEKSIKLLEKEKNQEEILSNAYRNLTILYNQNQDYSFASASFEKGKKLFFQSQNTTPRTIAKLYFEEASLLFGQKKIKEANSVLKVVFKTLIPTYSDHKNILPDSNSLYAETILLDALDLQAAIFMEQNQPIKALNGYALSFQIEDLFANLLVYENSKIINQIRIRNRTEKCISIYDFLYLKEKKVEYLEKAFQLSERTKSGVLKSYLSNKIKVSKEEKLLSEQLQNWNNEILKEQQKGKLAEVSKINEALKKQNELMLLLKEMRTKNQINTVKNTAIKPLYAKLEKDKAILVEYFFGLNKLYSFTISDHKIKMQNYEVSENSTAKINTFLNYFSDANAILNDVKGYTESGYLLYEHLKLPKNTSYQNLIIVPDGLLNFLPFEALITQKSVTNNFATMPYLLNKFRIAYTNSASFYLDEKPSLNTKETVLGIFPIFEKTQYELSFSKAEMESIKNNFDGEFFKNEKATFGNFKANAPHYSVLHLSTHASSGDIETPASIKFYDQEILYSELYNLKINPSLVVLSACETGIGKLYKSEGAMSIARGFQKAGAKNLLISLWKVNDYTTSVFMENFYKKIKNNETYFEANAKAKRDFLNDKTISNAKKSPYYWSAFVYYGGVNTPENGSNNYGYFFGLVFLIGLFLAIKLFKK